MRLHRELNMFQKSSVVNSTTGNSNNPATTTTTSTPKQTDPDPYPFTSNPSGAIGSNYNNERITLPSSFKDSKQYINNYLNSNRPIKEDTKSQHHTAHNNRLRSSNSHSSAHQSHTMHSSSASASASTPLQTTSTMSSQHQQEVVAANNHQSNSGRNSHHHQQQQPSSSASISQRLSGNSNHQFARSSTNPQIYQNPTNLQQQSSHRQDTNKSEQQSPQTSAAATARLSNSAQAADSPSSFNQPARSASQSYSSRQRSPSSSTLRDEMRASQHSPRQDQQDRSDDMVTVIREELEELADAFKDSDLETLSSLEKNLPVELSFLIRQQAYCMARMNYLDRQVRELKEAKHNVPQASNHHQQHHQQQHQMNHHRLAGSSTAAHLKHGNGFIPSDDSGGEYSRATISDEDELSSLLDQIAKSVRPERGNLNHQNISVNHHQLLQHQQQQQQHQAQLNSRATNFSVISSHHQPHHQQYAIINPSQLHTTHHQAAVPVFVMGSPIAVAHPSSISSNILPGVHFQPEPRYNQYYEDFYSQNAAGLIGSNNNSSSTTHSMMNTRQTMPQLRPQPNTSQFDTSISAIEQLVNQKERRQIRSQLKSADNWLKMRSSTMCNLNEDFANEDKRQINEGQSSNGQGGPSGSKSSTSTSSTSAHQMMMNSTVASSPENSNNVIQSSENNR